MVAHGERLKAYFEEHPPRSARQAARHITELTGIRRSPGRVRGFLHRLGLSVRMTGQLPAKADAAAQQAFIDQRLTPLLERSERGEVALLFAAAVHFLLGALLGRVWCSHRRFLRCGAARFRLNVLGALDARTHRLTALYNRTYVNAVMFVAFLQRLLAVYADRPVALILDNARCQKCELVSEAAAGLNIELVYLPPYSPNLNMIERLWKLIKVDICHARYYDCKERFEKAIVACLNSLHLPYYKELMKTWLAPNFQTFQHAQNAAI